jgi:CRP-like cAMP-binding protein
MDNISLYIIDKGEVEEILTNDNMKSTSVIKLYKVHLFSYWILKYKIQRGEPFGLRSFFTSEKRDLSALSRNFSTLLEIKKADFLEVLEKNKKDYVNSIFSTFSFPKKKGKILHDKTGNAIECLFGRSEHSM